MHVVYVKTKNGKPLMPTKRCGRVRKLLKEGKAKVKGNIYFIKGLKNGHYATLMDINNNTIKFPDAPKGEKHLNYPNLKEYLQGNHV